MDMTALTGLLLEIDKLKAVQRRTYTEGGARLENSAEHSWHLAMAAWIMAEQLGLEVNHEKLLKLALVHDLGEIDGGDTFLYAPERDQAAENERRCIKRLEQQQPSLPNDFVEMWEEQETGGSAETRLLKVADRLLPFMLNIATEGRAWRENGVKRHQVEARHAFIAHEVPEVYQWISEQIATATRKGWLAE